MNQPAHYMLIKMGKSYHIKCLVNDPNKLKDCLACAIYNIKNMAVNTTVSMLIKHVALFCALLSWLYASCSIVCIALDIVCTHH